MKRSETIVKIAPALLAAQKKIGAAKKDAKNPFFKSSYADLGSVMEACKDALNENGVTVLQPIGTDEVGVYVETVLMHESGEFISDRLRIAVPQRLVTPNKTRNESFEPYFTPDPQAQGSAISYARRYSLQSMVFIPAEDDDGNRATQAATAPQKEEGPSMITPDQKMAIARLLPKTGKNMIALNKYIMQWKNKKSYMELTSKEAEALLKMLEKDIKSKEEDVDINDIDENINSEQSDFAA